MKNRNFVHLHVHDEYSQLDGLGKPQQYAIRAKELGFKAIAQTNHGNVDGAIKFQKACLESGIQPIFGSELYIVSDLSDKNSHRYHILVLVKNKIGWQNLLKILTIANLQGFYRKPRINSEILLRHCDGLIISSACSGSFIKTSWGRKLFQDIGNEIGDDLYLEIMPHDYKDQVEMNKLVLALSQEYNVCVIASNDCHYVLESDSKTQEVLLAIQRNAKWKDPSRWKFDINGLHLRTYGEMVDGFKNNHKYIPDDVRITALAETLAVQEKCKDFMIDKVQVVLPKVFGYKDRDETELLIELVNKGAVDRLECFNEVYKTRVDEELELICELGFQRYFLIVWELIKWCKDNDIMTGPGRGSVGGSLVAYLLHITDVDPIKYKLLFSRFISPARIDLPDIDMDFEDIKRDLVRKHLEDCYGKNNVSGLSTFLEMKGRAALRDVSRVFDLPYKDVDLAAKSIVVRGGGDFRSSYTIEDAFDTFEDGIIFKKKYPEIAELAMKLEGQIRGSGQHAAAMCVSKLDLSSGQQCNLCIRRGVVVANWEKDDAEYMGMMKLDILGLSALTILNKCKKMIKQNCGVDIVFDKIPFDDKSVYTEINSGNTVGAFQIGSFGLSQFCRELGVENFNDLVHATALWRPGTLRSGMATEFSQRKHGKSKVKYIHPVLKNLTQDTYGIILYQEQVMQLMYELGGLPWKTCDTVRKVISKSQGDELFRSFKKQFADGCVQKKTVDYSTAEKIWDELSNFGSYSFNLSHSVEYSMITYWDMYLKVHYPVEFMACTLTHIGLDKKQECIDECNRIGIKIRLPKIGISSPLEWICKKDEKVLYMPFCEIKGIGEKIAQKICLIKKPINSGFFANDTTVYSKNITEILNRIKAFDVKVEVTDLRFADIGDLFSFDISVDKLGRFRKMFDFINSKLDIKRICEVDFDNPSRKDCFYLGVMQDVKFGYRKSVLKVQKEKTGIGEIAEIKENLGGVYGFFKDHLQTSTMMVFNSELYQRKKYDIEHCSGKQMLIKANHPTKNTNLFCSDLLFAEDIERCCFGDFGIKLINSIDRNIMSGISDMEICKECSLHRECSAPVLPSIGKSNVMVIGEAPGREEDKLGYGFAGRSGNILWSELRKYRFLRKNFYITNAVKCFPSKSKTPQDDHIAVCKNRWLTRELSLIKPTLILALGNVCLKSLLDVDGGISKLNGLTKWSDTHNCWISWCVHPSFVLRSDDNKLYFENGIKNFVECYRGIS